MITKNDLYDISFVFISIRIDIKNKYNSEVLSKIISVLKENNFVFDNQIRKAISGINGLNMEQWSPMFHENIYVNHQFLKNTCIYNLLTSLCVEIKYLLEHSDFERAYDLIDAIHCLPNIIADNHFHIPKPFWKTYIKPYRKKWDKTFLLKQEATIRRRAE